MSCLERTKPLLGTWVTIRAGVAQAEAMSAAFADIALVHDLMSFHAGTSELSRLNREAARRPIAVSAHTLAVLAVALEVAEASDGAFDPCCGGAAVAEGGLPRPEGAPDPDPSACWRDVEIDLEAGAVGFRRPLWLDLGGVAKGYAVDLACARLAGLGVRQAVVEAGGDLRVFGPEAERVQLDPGPGAVTAPAIELANRALASSGGARSGEAACAAHFDGRDRLPLPAGRFATVMADRCALADALTKVALARGAGASPLLARFGADGLVHSPDAGWLPLGAAA